jgi:serine/threonine protein kinase
MTGKEVATRLTDFFVIEKIGDGAYSEVFKVKRITDNRIYALKKVSLQSDSTGKDG